MYETDFPSSGFSTIYIPLTSRLERSPIDDLAWKNRGEMASSLVWSSLLGVRLLSGESVVIIGDGLLLSDKQKRHDIRL